ncbi:Transmembrane protein 68 [Chytridiales sp. JEL 0842]|nr:Transmembrane protein 68 [Chytridiales sp. JEL 0842]
MTFSRPNLINPSHNTPPLTPTKPTTTTTTTTFPSISRTSSSAQLASSTSSAASSANFEQMLLDKADQRKTERLLEESLRALEASAAGKLATMDLKSSKGSSSSSSQQQQQQKFQDKKVVAFRDNVAETVSESAKDNRTSSKWDSEFVKAIFHVSALLSVYYWRFGGMMQFLFATALSLLLAPNRWAFRKYKEFMDWPDSWLQDWKPAPAWLLLGITGPWRLLYPVKVRGIENVPHNARKIFMVGNHQLSGLDIPTKFAQIYVERGIRIRALMDRVHGIIPFWKHLLVWCGAAIGTRENCSTLMKQGEPMLVYPGGALEVMKSEKAPKYAVMWQNRTGFATMAIEHGYTIIPFSAIGYEEIFWIPFSIPDFWIWPLIGDPRAKKKNKGPIDTTSNGRFEPEFTPDNRIPIPWPAFAPPQASYVRFGNPIDASKYKPEEAAKLRDDVKEEVLKGLEELKEWQRTDPERWTNLVKVHVDAVVWGVEKVGEVVFGLGKKIKAQ